MSFCVYMLCRHIFTLDNSTTVSEVVRLWFLPVVSEEKTERETLSDDEKHEGVEGEEGEEDSEEVSPLTYIILTFHLVIDLTSYLAVYILY